MKEVECEISRRDEIGELAEDINRLYLNLRQMIGRLEKEKGLISKLEKEKDSMEKQEYAVAKQLLEAISKDSKGEYVITRKTNKIDEIKFN